LGNFIAHSIGYGFGESPIPVKGRTQLMDMLALGNEELPSLLYKTIEKLLQVVKVFKAGI